MLGIQDHCCGRGRRSEPHFSKMIVELYCQRTCFPEWAYLTMISEQIEQRFVCQTLEWVFTQFIRMLSAALGALVKRPRIP